jgi:hypothetical protein
MILLYFDFIAYTRQFDRIKINQFMFNFFFKTRSKPKIKLSHQVYSYTSTGFKNTWMKYSSSIKIQLHTREVVSN